MLLNNSGSAQEGKYHKFVKEGMEWYNIVNTTYGGGECTFYYLYGKYQIKGDTLFNGVHYNILFYNDYPQDQICQYILFIREDTLQKKCIYWNLI
ncbi:MAG: hypothetical protein A2X02_04775 [Bacteroidetes bacterium GWF2_29_10]|nr:MAG: hypothetical protein A2X02_04775 [Bacteroidetes bacterium GWF2_29_10]